MQWVGDDYLILSAYILCGVGDAEEEQVEE
jgi:hypothetical protein